jgi:repressor LexA
MLTKRQKQVLDFIKSFTDKKGYAPSLEEIAKHLRLSSISTAHFHVSKLKKLGYLKKEENKPRAVGVYDTEPMLKIPLLGTIAAGQPIEAIEDKEMIKVPKSQLSKSGEHFALRVKEIA